MCSLHFCVVVLSHKHVHVVALIPDSVYTIGRHAVHSGTSYYIVYDALGIDRVI